MITNEKYRPTAAGSARARRRCGRISTRVRPSESHNHTLGRYSVVYQGVGRHLRQSAESSPNEFFSARASFPRWTARPDITSRRPTDRIRVAARGRGVLYTVAVPDGMRAGSCSSTTGSFETGMRVREANPAIPSDPNHEEGQDGRACNRPDPEIKKQADGAQRSACFLRH